MNFVCHPGARDPADEAEPVHGATIGGGPNDRRMRKLPVPPTARGRPFRGERQTLAASLVNLLTVLETDLNEPETALIGDILSRVARDFEAAVRC